VPKLPTFSEVAANPALLDKLTIPQINAFNEELKKILAGQGEAASLPSSPVELALKLSRGKWQTAPHLELINEHVLDLVAGKRERVLVSMPPRHGKSQLLSVWTPVWLFALRPQLRMIFCSYEARFASQWGRRIRDTIIMYSDALNIAIDPNVKAQDHFKLVSGGEFWSAGVDGPVSGKDADVLIIDDPIKNEEDAGSLVMRDKLWDWFQTSAFPRLEPKAFVIIIGTRWHQDDLIGRLESASNSGEGLHWDVLKLSAIAEGDDPLGREPGEALWPARFNLDALLQIKKVTGPYHWSALYQQRPSPEEGGGVRREWWKYYETLPDMEEFDDVVQSWDPTFKGKKDSDFVVGQVWGRKGILLYLIDQVRARMDTMQTIAAIRVMTAKYPRARGKLIEDSASGPAIISMLQHEVSGMVAVPTKKTRKEDRLQSIVPLIAAGNVLLPKAPWTADFVEECAAFPYGTHDDQVDAMSQALRYLQPRGWAKVGADWEEAKHGPVAQTTESFLKADFSSWIKKRKDKAERAYNHENGFWGRLPRGSSNSW
jgi:predicted phage terminase large subunit-like protein